MRQRLFDSVVTGGCNAAGNDRLRRLIVDNAGHDIPPGVHKTTPRWRVLSQVAVSQVRILPGAPFYQGRYDPVRDTCNYYGWRLDHALVIPGVTSCLGGH